MKQSRILHILIVLVAGFGVVALRAEDPRPNFTGTWVLDVAATAKANGKAAKSGQELTQRDSGAAGAPATVVMEMPNENTLQINGGRGMTIYQIDNVEHKTKVPNRGTEMEIDVKAKWDGAKLVTTVTQKMMNAGELLQTETKETRSIDKEGRLVYVFDRSAGGRAVPDMPSRGGGGRGGDAGGAGVEGAGGANTYKAIYTKKQ